MENVHLRNIQNHKKNKSNLENFENCRSFSIRKKKWPENLF